MSIEKVIDYVGSAAKLARRLEVSSQTVVQWRQGSRPLSLDRCMQMERLTGGKVRCEELRPDVDWTRAPDLCEGSEGQPVPPADSVAVGRVAA